MNIRCAALALLAALPAYADQGSPGPAADPSDSIGKEQVSQELIDRQPAIIDAAVARIAEASAPGAQVYFLGFAGFGDERVFAEEIALAEKQVAARYDSAARSLRLVNDRRDVETLPLASTGSLSYALDALGRVMDPDDVLFLALSSHGSEGASLSVSIPGLQPYDLSAGELAAALEHSGIRWRVIVISACYSGSFIDKLSDNQTIVITAASRHRPSFGCSDDRHLTYFGEGFYRDALPTAHTLREVFNLTRKSIAVREKELGVKPSHPQSYFGPVMETKLEEMERAPKAE